MPRGHHTAFRLTPRCIAGGAGLLSGAALLTATFATGRRPASAAPATQRLRGAAAGGDESIAFGNALPFLYGTAWKKERTADLVVQAIKAGFRGIDTACQPKHYKEGLVGEALARLEAEGIPRSSLWVQTKFTPIGGQDPNDVPYDRDAPLAEQVVQSVRRSLENLRTDRIDSLVLHSPLKTHDQTMQAWRAMESHVPEKVGQLGISNCYDLHRFRRLYDDAAVKPRVLQNRFYAQSGHDVELRRFCLERGITYQTFWTLSNRKELASPAMRAAAAAHGVEAQQILFRWLRQRGHQPLTGTKSAEHMAQDLSITTFELSDAEMAEIGALFGV